MTKAARKNGGLATATAAIVGAGESPFAALAAMAEAQVADMPEDEPAIDWAKPQVVGRGLICQMQGDMLLMAVNVGKVAKSKAKPSKSGDMLLLGTSAGFRALEGLGIKVGVNVGMANPAAPKKGIGSK